MIPETPLPSTGEGTPMMPLTPSTVTAMPWGNGVVLITARGIADSHRVQLTPPEVRAAILATTGAMWRAVPLKVESVEFDQSNGTNMMMVTLSGGGCLELQFRPEGYGNVGVDKALAQSCSIARLAREAREEEARQERERLEREKEKAK